MRSLTYVSPVGRSRLQPLGEDHRVAEHRIIHARLAAEDAGDAVSGVDAAVQRQLRLVGKVVAHARELAVHLQRD